MAKRKNLEKQVEFIHLLKANKLTTPNDFTIGVGNLIRQAREDNGMSQSELAKALNRRQGTISDIENGKSEIGILTLVQFAVELQKPISYFFPDSLLKEFITDVKSPFQHKMLEIAQRIEMYGENEFILKILDVLEDRFDKYMNPENYEPPYEEDDKE
jgi:transcriptional regulator with XRE-family HTH domain